MMSSCQNAAMVYHRRIISFLYALLVCSGLAIGVGAATPVKNSVVANIATPPPNNKQNAVDINKKPKNDAAPSVVHWGYNYPDHPPSATGSGAEEELTPEKWKEKFPQCDSSRKNSRQSPVAIDTKSIRAGSDPQRDALKASSYEEEPSKSVWNAVNTGHGVQFSANWAHTPEIYDGGLPGHYTFTQFHFHWGGINGRGSEHIIDGKPSALELHLVHRRSYESDLEATRDPVGLAVVGVLFEVSNQDKQLRTVEPFPPHLDLLLSTLNELDQPDAKRDLVLKGFRLVDLLPANRTFYRYMGSLTTPPCSEAAIWSVMATPLKIPEKYLLAFRKLHSKKTKPGNTKDDLLVDNFRPVQPLAGRNVSVYMLRPVTHSMQRSIEGNLRPINISRQLSIPEEQHAPDVFVF
ncbi:carbonic anhydrase 2-like [Paramacrobiotus metropolitanus]|uniref:carbonic anhydrase 2-like n=1 Tax=Paramacrobiotus metropolitanus TaxID=2943436 RepID=UPI00244568B1|nr:carbonic anhydrase 2-like [Paramacrobiotus metropolitanus]